MNSTIKIFSRTSATPPASSKTAESEQGGHKENKKIGVSENDESDAEDELLERAKKVAVEASTIYSAAPHLQHRGAQLPRKISHAHSKKI